MRKHLIILLFITILISCGTSSGRSEIEETIYNAASVAEKRDVEEFMKIISKDYLDREERTRADIEEKIRKYFNRFKGISVNILNVRTVNKGVNDAEVITEISFSSGIGKVFSKVFSSYGEVYRFYISMLYLSERWVVKNAEWEWMSIDEIYPESLKVLRELFPDTF